MQPDTRSEVGEYATLKLINGKPAISYKDSINHHVHYLRALDAMGARWRPPKPLDTNCVAGCTSLAAINGKPAVAYQDQSTASLRFVVSHDAEGLEWNEPVVIGPTPSQFSSCVLISVEGRPAVLLREATSERLLFVRAMDAEGLDWENPVTIDSDSVPFQISAAIVDRNPAAAYMDSRTDTLRFLRAKDPGGRSWNEPIVIDDSNYSGTNPSLVIVDGRPAISYRRRTHGDLRFVRASDPDGSTWDAPITVDENCDAYWTSMAIINGLPTIAYRDFRHPRRLKWVAAQIQSGAKWDTPLTVDDSGNVGRFSSLISIGNRPAIAYLDDSRQQLKFALGPAIVNPAQTRAWRFAGILLVIALFIAVVTILAIRAHARVAAGLSLPGDFSRRLIEYQETERRHMASQLRENIGNRLLSLQDQALTGLKGIHDNDPLHAGLEKMSDTISISIEDTAAMLHGLRPHELDRLGLTQAIQSIVRALAETQTLKIDADISPLDGLFPPKSEIHIFRIVQEALNNIVKHAEATEARVEVWQQAASARIRITDNGKGIDASTISSGKGLGLISMNERARWIGAAFEIKSEHGQGARLFFSIPIKPASSQVLANSST